MTDCRHILMQIAAKFRDSSKNPAPKLYSIEETMDELQKAQFLHSVM